MNNLDTSVASISISKGSPPPIKPSRNPHPSSYGDLCFCKSLSVTFNFYRIVGCFPITWYHENNECTFKGSYPWLAYSLVICIVFTVQLFLSTDLLHFDKDKPLPELLTSINEIMYMIFVIILSFQNVSNYPKFVQTLNNLIPIVRESNLHCKSSLKTFRNIQAGLIGLVIFYCCIEHFALAYMHYSENYYVFGVNVFINRTIQFLPFFFYLEFFAFCYLFITMLACYERLTISALRFAPMHPLDDIDETNNTHTFMGMITYSICKEEHPSFGQMIELCQPELVEYLRHLHERISLAMYDVNTCMNPQLLFHTVIELTVLIIHWYEVIIYTSYDFGSSFATTINVLNWIFVLGHSIGLFLFMKTAQEMKNTVHSLVGFLLEYSTRISNVDEHQQVRIFIEKLQQHRPITASGVFNIDLGIAGPISANILTYVLVALQFEIPQG